MHQVVVKYLENRVMDVRRLRNHNDGKCPYTSKFRPWELVYSESFEKDSDAFQREKQIKKWSRAKEALIEGNQQRLKALSRKCHN